MTLLLFWQPLASPDMKTASILVQPFITISFAFSGIPWEMVAPRFWEMNRFLPVRPILDLFKMGASWRCGGINFAGRAYP
jgi:hypothetical protein